MTPLSPSTWHTSRRDPTVAGEQVVPPLENGGRLGVAEFHRRYAAMPQQRNAELIDGTVYPPPRSATQSAHILSPVFERSYGWSHVKIMAWLGDDTSIRLPRDNEFHPDAYLRLREEFGGAARVHAQNYTIRAVKPAAGIVTSSAACDLSVKQSSYLRGGIAEYPFWRVADRAFGWLSLPNGQYETIPSRDSVQCRRVFPGLWLARPQSLRRPANRVADAAGQPGHSGAFRLRRRAGRSASRAEPPGASGLTTAEPPPDPT